LQINPASIRLADEEVILMRELVA
jgi:hypothetical protein